MKNGKRVLFRGKEIDVAEARRMVVELSAAIESVDPDLSDSPVGKTIPTVIDPRWYSETVISQPIDGSTLCFREPAMGWRGFILPWPEVAGLIGLLTRQMAVAATGVRPDTIRH